MPSIDWNRRKWDVNYHWNADGDMWSRGYGGPAMQWRLSLLPRILPFVPAGSILEIAPGFGRWQVFCSLSLQCALLEEERRGLQ